MDMFLLCTPVFVREPSQLPLWINFGHDKFGQQHDGVHNGRQVALPDPREATTSIPDNQPHQDQHQDQHGIQVGQVQLQRGLFASQAPPEPPNLPRHVRRGSEGILAARPSVQGGYSRLGGRQLVEQVGGR